MMKSSYFIFAGSRDHTVAFEDLRFDGHVTNYALQKALTIMA